jgi:uncharacterized protein
MKKIFVGPDGIRAGWRFLIFAVLWTGLSTAAQLLIHLVYKGHEGMHPLDYLVSDGVGFLTALAAAAIMGRIEKRRLSEYGLPLSSGFLRRFVEGLLWGAVPVAVLMSAVWLLGGVTFAGFALAGQTLAGWALLWTVTMVVLGLFEEFLFRGYPLRALSDGLGFWPASVLLSAGFGALHYFTKPMETFADALSVSLIGLLLCFTIARTGNLWLAVGFHTAFDFFALPLFGAPNTGNDGKAVTGHLLATQFNGPPWLTGGPCGLEASLLIFPVIALTFLLFHRLYPVRSPAKS